MLDELTRLIQSGALQIPGSDVFTNQPPVARWFVENNTGEVIPPFACIQVVGTSRPYSERTYFSAGKPVDIDGTAGWYVFNGPKSIDLNKRGAVFDGPAVRAIASGVTAGTRYAPVIGAWNIVANPNGPFIGAGDDPTFTGAARIFIVPKGDGGPGSTSRMKGYLKTCLAKCDATVEVTVYDPFNPTAGNAGESGCGSGRNGLIAWNLHNGVSVFPEINFGGAASVDLTMQNRWALDGLAGSAVIFEKVYGQGHATGSAPNDWEWQVVEIEDRIARWMVVQFSKAQSPSQQDSWNKLSTQEGTDPEPCGQLDIACDLDCSCVQDGAVAYAFYLPEASTTALHRYRVVSPPISFTKQTVLDLNEGNEITFECIDGEYCAEGKKKEITVIDCGDTLSVTDTLFCISQDIFECLDLCEWYCLYCPDEPCDPPCVGECIWRAEDLGNGFYHWTLQSNNCTTSNGTDPKCSCYCPPTISNPTPGVDYPTQCGPPNGDCCGYCSYEWQSGGVQAWVLRPDKSLCIGQDPACVCATNPDTSGFPSNPSPGDFYQIPCGRPPCTGDCQWVYREGTFTPSSGASFPYFYWENPSSNCDPASDNCTCCLPPAIGNPVVDQFYPVACAPLPDGCVGQCIHGWDAQASQWVALAEGCCGTDENTNCYCDPPADDGITDGQIDYGECGPRDACDGDCIYVYSGPSGPPGECFGITMSKSGNNPTGALPGQEPPLFGDGKYVYTSYSQDTEPPAPNGQQCTVQTWIIHWCNTTVSYIDLFLAWWENDPNSPKNDGWGLQGPTNIGCSLFDREFWAGTNEQCPPGPPDPTLVPVRPHAPDPLTCVTGPAGWRLLYGTCTTGCVCEDPPSDLTGFPPNPKPGDTHTVIDGCAPQSGGLIAAPMSLEAIVKEVKRGMRR